MQGGHGKYLLSWRSQLGCPAWKVGDFKQKGAGLLKFLKDHPSCYLDVLEKQEWRLGEVLGDFAIALLRSDSGDASVLPLKTESRGNIGEMCLVVELVESFFSCSDGLIVCGGEEREISKMTFSFRFEQLAGKLCFYISSIVYLHNQNSNTCFKVMWL